MCNNNNNLCSSHSYNIQYVRMSHSSYQCVWVKEAYNVGMWYLQVGKDDNNQCILVLAKHFVFFI